MSQEHLMHFLMGIDKCHKQLKKLVEGDEWATGLTEDEDRLREWMVFGPDVARIVFEFEENSVLKQTRSFQNIENLILLKEANQLKTKWKISGKNRNISTYSFLFIIRRFECYYTHCQETALN